MNAKTKRKHIESYGSALRDLELAEVCVEILQGMDGATPERCIKQLRHYQKQCVTRMDRAANALGAPYGASI